MKIDLTKLKKMHWYEDEDGNEIPCEEGVVRPEFKEGQVVYYRHFFPLEFHEYIDEYCYHPTNPIIKFLCKRSRRFYRWISKGKERTFKNIMDCRTTFACGQDCIVGMVTSGDYTLAEAVYIYANSCERCMNVLEYKYTGGKDGYPEFSEEWKKANTVCDFCRDIELKGDANNG